MLRELPNKLQRNFKAMPFSGEPRICRQSAVDSSVFWLRPTEQWQIYTERHPPEFLNENKYIILVTENDCGLCWKPIPSASSDIDKMTTLKREYAVLINSGSHLISVVCEFPSEHPSSVSQNSESLVQLSEFCTFVVVFAVSLSILGVWILFSGSACFIIQRT